MPNVYKAGQQIPEFKGVVRGGVTVVIHHPEEVQGLQAICSVAGSPPEDPMRAIYRALIAPELDLGSWLAWQRRLRTYSSSWREVPSTSLQDDWAALNIVLSLARDIWMNQGVGTEQLCLAMSIPDPESNSERVLEFEGEKPGLVFHKGSIIATLMKIPRLPFKVAGYAVAFFSGLGIVPSQWAENLMEAMRSKAQEDGVEALPRFDELQPHQISGKQGLIVFLHGLLSTDLGLFDSLIKKLREDQTVRERVDLVGWPHDTLTGIDKNGLDLFRELTRVVGPDGPKVAFVCHSRGGLVARNAAVRLYNGKGSKWREILRGCLTFGTPHEGAKFAKLPGDLLGWLIVLQALRKGKGAAPLAGILLYFARHELQGIEDLQPGEKDGQFLKDLLEQEIHQAEQVEGGKERLLDILAVGGVVPPRTDLPTFLATHALAGSKHDLVVETTSSMPRFFPEDRVKDTECDHFGYFSEAETQKLQSSTIHFLKDVLGLYRTEAEELQVRMSEVAAASESTQDDPSQSEGDSPDEQMLRRLNLRKRKG